MWVLSSKENPVAVIALKEFQVSKENIATVPVSLWFDGMSSPKSDN